MENGKNRGIVTSRQCPYCGHHEVGFIDSEGVFHPLRPGMRIEVFSLAPSHVIPPDHQLQDTEEIKEYSVWIPHPALRNRILRIRYGVWIQKDQLPVEMNPVLYKVSYLNKIRLLIEKGAELPLAVVFDRFFTAPHLAGGTPEQITYNLWRDIEEIRRPVMAIERWLKSPDTETERELIRPFKPDDIRDKPPSEEEINSEFASLKLVEFLESLAL